MSENRAVIVGRRLKIWRDFHGLTQKELAKKLGRTQQYLSKCEQGKQLATTELLLDLCEMFDVDLGYFDPRRPGVEAMFKGRGEGKDRPG